MKRKIVFKITIPLLTALVVFNACKKDYIIGGTPQGTNIYNNTTTYDVLKSMPMFDTLVRLIDTAGIKDKINQQGVTMFAPPNPAIFSYLNARTLVVQQTNINGKFALDSLFYYLRNNINGTRDSLLMYLIPNPLPFSSLTQVGAVYPTLLSGDSVVVSYENTGAGSSSLTTFQPRVVYFTQLWQHVSLSNNYPASSIIRPIGVHTLCQTSGILTQTGVLNVLPYYHTLFFYGTKQ